MKKILVGLSGGVDSSVALAILKNQGHDVAGVSLIMYENDQGCSGPEDREDAKKVCQQLDVPFYTYNMVDIFKEKVIDKFAKEYKNGRTPNPCIDCNTSVKFIGLINAAKEYGYDYIATGHYGAIEYDKDKDRYLLKKSRDKYQDQSYFLFNLKKDWLPSILFPLEGLDKDEVRSIGSRMNLEISNKPDSQDICFIPDEDYSDYLERELGIKNAPGYFLDLDGLRIGKHKGYTRYTIGQRRGLGLSLPEPGYVIDINPFDNTVTVGTKEDLYRKSMYIEDLNLIYTDEIVSPTKCSVKIRYSQDETECTIYPKKNGVYRVEFEEPITAVTPGQGGVLYLGDYVLGGGPILG